MPKSLSFSGHVVVGRLWRSFECCPYGDPYVDLDGGEAQSRRVPCWNEPHKCNHGNRVVDCEARHSSRPNSVALRAVIYTFCPM